MCQLRALTLLLGSQLVLAPGCNNDSAEAGRSNHGATAAAVAPVVTAQASLSNPRPGAPLRGTTTLDFELRDWFAFGSGCRSRPTSPGDVSLEVVKIEGMDGAYRVELRLPNFGIAEADPWMHRLPTFARECGIRLAVHPTPGRRLSSVTAAPVYVIDKPSGAKIRLRARLSVGDTTVSRFERWLPIEQRMKADEQPVMWSTDSNSHSVFETVLCEQPKVVGLDLSIALARETQGRSLVNVTMSQRAVSIVLHFAQCGAMGG